MRPFPFVRFKALPVSFLLLLLVSPAICGATVRQPVWAGRFYPKDSAELQKTIATLSERAGVTQVEIPTGKQLQAVILPHAGYIYSGLTAAHAVKVLSGRTYKRVVLLGPDHRVGFQGCAVSDTEAYQTPLGLVPLDREGGRLRRESNLFHANAASDRSEHSLEVIVPYLQYYLKRFDLIPVVVGPVDVAQAAAMLAPLLVEASLLVVSSDLSHFLSYSQAVAKDKQTIAHILNLDEEAFRSCPDCACGKWPILVTLHLARKYGWQPLLLHYSNSGDTAGGRDKVVGYAAIAFYGEGPMSSEIEHPSYQLSDLQGQVLVRLARASIAEKLGDKQAASANDDVAETLAKRCFQEKKGTFVTLKIDDRLRGCIGSLKGSQPLMEDVKDNALKAAFSDPRFEPLSLEELRRVHISVSVLTEPQTLPYTGARDLLTKLRVNTDGVIIRKGTAGATFLPQVWEQLPEPDKFMSHLCLKAGLSGDAWQKRDLKVYTYQVQYFEEAR